MHKLSTGVVLKTCTPGTPSPHSLTWELIVYICDYRKTYVIQI
jgi:hypothetical protein